MKAHEAYEALEATLIDIAEILKNVGLKTETRCRFSGVDFDEHEAFGEGVAILFGEIFFFPEGTQERAALECAVGIDDGEVTNEELLREVSDLRAEAKRIASLITEDTRAEDIFKLLEESESEKDDEDTEFDNGPEYETEKSGIPWIYIIGGAVCLLLLIIPFFFM